MSLEAYLSEAAIVADMPATTKQEALDVLVDTLLAACKNNCPDLSELSPGQPCLHQMDRGGILAVLRERELLGSTGIGDGVAIPHGKAASCDRLRMVVGRSLAGCDFEAVDGAKCQVFCLLLAPDGPGHGPGRGSAHGHFSVLVRLARIFRSVDFRKRFMEAADAAAIWQLINQAWHD